jgi:hypothetical protein
MIIFRSSSCWVSGLLIFVWKRGSSDQPAHSKGCSLGTTFADDVQIYQTSSSLLDERSRAEQQKAYAYLGKVLLSTAAALERA